jgi:type II secretory ATPase GspE/PulE/Tfp pilus assembly ATPase PilB-like protein
MGFSERNYDNFIKCHVQPYGLALVCGPTGSGKTTTLHSALAYINKTETKIWTAEDPVEITQKGLRQVQVKPKIGFNFAAAMRSFLRADPDVIMVGEMRDKETTHIGIEASLTGHLVFSTLHTNTLRKASSACSTWAWIRSISPMPFCASWPSGLCAPLCPDCKNSTTRPGKSMTSWCANTVRRTLNGFSRSPHSSELMLCKPVGCDLCANTGYRGRMGIHELLTGTDEMKKLVQRRAQMEEIRVQAVKDGMTTLKQDGIEKIFSGQTDLLQVRKVCIK